MYIASGHEAEFSGHSKERLVFRRVKQNLENLSPGIKVELGVRFDGLEIDLVGSLEAEHVAVEGKFKLRSDGAVPDNRKAAFFDLYNLERYVDSGRYSNGLFVWLTDEPKYIGKAKGDSADFSTHHRQVYQPGTPLHVKRSRNKMPDPLVLTQAAVRLFVAADLEFEMVRSRSHRTPFSTALTRVSKKGTICKLRKARKQRAWHVAKV